MNMLRYGTCTAAAADLNLHELSLHVHGSARREMLRSMNFYGLVPPHSRAFIIMVVCEWLLAV